MTPSSSVKKLNKFRDKIDNLTIPIRENFTRIAEIDRECVFKQQFVEQLALPMVQHWTKTRRDIRQKRYKTIKNALEKLEQLANEKVKIANQSYEEIDRHVVQLDKLYAKITQKQCQKPPKNEKSTSHGDRRKAEKIVQKEVPFDPTTVVDMPVDPNEPTYCICRQVSFGCMILCDNKQCSIEWFHFDCVGLTEEPKGKWFCPVCKKTNLEKHKRKT